MYIKNRAPRPAPCVSTCFQYKATCASHPPGETGGAAEPSGWHPCAMENPRPIQAVWCHLTLDSRSRNEQAQRRLNNKDNLASDQISINMHAGMLCARNTKMQTRKLKTLLTLPFIEGESCHSGRYSTADRNHNRALVTNHA